jgi:hypothetical protein
MKVIIAGSRDFNDYYSLTKAIMKSGLNIEEVVCGMARGVDLLGKQWADERGIYVKEFPADWNTHGQRAGPIRNTEMAKYADALIAIWDGESKGTANMISQARAKNLKVFVYLVGEKYDTANSNH